MEAQSLGSRGSFSKSEGFSGSEVSDELDHVPLTRRRRILLANQQRSDSADCNGSENPFMFVTVEEEDERCNAQDILSLSPACSSRRVETLVQGQGQDSKCEDPGEVSTRELCNTVIESSARGDCSQHIKSRESDLPQSGNLDSSVFTSPHTSRVRDECAEDLLHLEESGIDRCFNSDAPITKIKDEVCNYIADDYMDHIVLKERQRMLLAGKLLGATKPVLEGGFEALPGVHLQKAVKENERIDVAGGETVAAKDDKNVSSQSTTVKIKDEPQNDNELDEDEADHVFLGDRMKLQRSKDDSKLSMPNELLKNPFPFEEKYSPIMSEPAKAYSINRPRKRKKTATDSVESALEEDAPGLLQVLIAKGVLVDEIKLYGETENDEAIDESSSEDSFTELESVISKIFTRRQSFLKLAPIRYGKGARASYCLACLISLVEQTRYLQFRKWPAEWGWCRDLQSFIFVFERHNRIVLERPEYGYATYFFELVDSLPIEWQIKRLVTAMKFTSCSRISLIENKALSIGEDMTEGEAKVLIGYGWVPNSGLGTMLKYRGRVVHDRKNENDASEWRSKIGKLLMDGYNGGTVVATEIPENDMEYVDSPNTQIKVEI